MAGHSRPAPKPKTMNFYVHLGPEEKLRLERALRKRGHYAPSKAQVVRRGIALALDEMEAMDDL